MMKRMILCVVTMMVMLTAMAANVLAAPISVIPQPKSMTVGEGEFVITKDTVICCRLGGEKRVAEMLASYLAPAMGYKLKVVTGKNTSAENVIRFYTGEGSCPIGTQAESYGLSITPKQIFISARASTGLFYGVQTLRQLLPVKIFSPTKVDGVKWTVPAVTISDAPRFGWRGLMLDASRHFQNVDTVKRLLDQMAMHKLNVFHWHLVDGHGWRIEIKKYPRLCTVGGFRR